MKYRRYAEYKDSGVEWLGEVPAYWEVKRLKHLLSEPLMYGASESGETDSPHYPRYIRITDITEGGGLRGDTFRSLAPETAEPYLLADGDVLFARSGATVGKAFVYRQSWGKACYAGYLIRARPDLRRMEPAWLRYCSQTDYYWQYIAAIQIQATIQNVSAERYASLYLPCPSLSEHKFVVAFLDQETAQIDALIAKQELLIAVLQEKRQALISHAVTKGLNPDAPMKESGVEWLGRCRRIGLSFPLDIGMMCNWERCSTKRKLLAILRQRNELNMRYRPETCWSVKGAQ